MSGSGKALSAELVHSLVATGLADPERLAAWGADPAQLAQLGVPPEAVDVEALRDFAGLSVKIRHNGCRGHLPRTFRLLACSGLELAFFRDYTAAFFARQRRGLKAISDRLDGIAEHAEAWCRAEAPEPAARRLIRDIVLHERTLARFRSRARPVEAEPPEAPAPLSLASVPVLRGTVEVHVLSCHPAQVDKVLAQREPDLGAIERGARTVVYHLRDTGSVRTIEVEPGVGHVLAGVDGRRSIGEMAGEVLGDAALGPALVALVRQLVELELVGVAAAEVR
ncbi:MAG: hypothetical protein Tsb0020_52590 [Haliangiales bacterium]